MGGRERGAGGRPKRPAEAQPRIVLGQQPENVTPAPEKRRRKRKRGRGAPRLPLPGGGGLDTPPAWPLPAAFVPALPCARAR